MFSFKKYQENIRFYDYFFTLLKPFISWFFSHLPSWFFLIFSWFFLPSWFFCRWSTAFYGCLIGSLFRPYATECLICQYSHVEFACSYINSNYIWLAKIISDLCQTAKQQLTGYTTRCLCRCRENKCQKAGKKERVSLSIILISKIFS